MIHFFLTHSKDAANSPFGDRLRELGVQHLIIAGEVRHQYRHRAWMLFVGRPQTAWFAVRAAWRSLARERPIPQAVVVWTHIEALIVALFRALLGRRDTKLVLVGFILTERSGSLHRWLRRLYFDTVFSVVDLAIVHSRAEAERYAELFKGRRTRFVFIPWGSHIDNLEALRAQPPDTGAADVLCAGRSGRDYPTLFRALGGQGLRVKVVCDLADALAGCQPAPDIEVLDRCYGAAYLRELLHARCVAVPLGVGDISAGQMVLLQAMEMGKAVVLTRTATTVDYVRDGHDALMCEPGDADGLRAQVLRALADDTLREQIGANARQTFVRRFTVPAVVHCTRSRHPSPLGGCRGPPHPTADQRLRPMP
jgi:glycosyltransferase involved in cell wall biosynthesis